MRKDQKKREDLQTIYNTPSERIDLKSEYRYVAKLTNGSFLYKVYFRSSFFISIYHTQHQLDVVAY